MLTAAQHKTLQFIHEYMTREGYAPTTGEIAEGIGIKSRGVVYRYLQALEEANKIRLLPNRRRNIELILEGEAANDTSIPLMGRIAAGSPIEAIPGQDHIDLAGVFLGGNRYALQVKGDSMIDEGIFDGDIVVCEYANTARNGQIVVALVDRQEATLKRLKRNSDKTVTLIPANSGHKPMTFPPDRVEVQGIYVGLIRY